jgi:hypothetical protein
MLSLRWGLLCAGLSIAVQLQATPPLTTISDTLFNADGTPFNGVVTVSWPSFEASDTSNVAAETEKIPVKNGILYVQLVPTTDANTAAIYTVQYSNLGVALSSEAWSVAPSNFPLRVRDVRVPPGTVSGSGPATVTIINLSDVNGLQNALNARAIIGTGFTPSRAAVIDATGAIDGAIGSLSDCLHVDGTSAPCSTSSSTTTFVDSERPSGTVNGSNSSFSLASSPNPASSLAIFRNGLLLRQGTDYSVSANGITFQSGAVPQPGDVVVASYRLSAGTPGVGFVDQEAPSGTMNGVNAAFTLSQPPTPSSSLVVYRNGLHLTAGVDYTEAGSTITFTPTLVPQPGDILLCSYRTTQ